MLEQHAAILKIHHDLEFLYDGIDQFQTKRIESFCRYQASVMTHRKWRLLDQIAENKQYVWIVQFQHMEMFKTFSQICKIVL